MTYNEDEAFKHYAKNLVTKFMEQYNRLKERYDYLIMTDSWVHEILNKLHAGEDLTSKEIRNLVWGYEIDRMCGDDGRWTRSVSSIIELEGELWQIDWEQGLTEYQESLYGEQPYRVKKVEKTVTRVEVSYKPLGDEQ